MGRLYKACERSKQAGKARLTKPQLDDLILWKAFLQKASRGISINRLVCRWPTRIVRVDACPQGIGGYCLKSGLAWRYQLPEHLLGRATLNTLEFLAAFVGMIVEFHEGAAWTDEDVLLSQETAPQQRDGLLMVPREREQGGGHALPRFRSRRRGTDRLDHEKLLTVCSTELQDHPFAASPYFADWRLAAAAAQNAALADSTRAKRDSSWRCYERFLGRIDGVGREPLKDSDEKRKQKRSPASPPPFGTDGFAPDNLRKLAMDPCPVPFVPPSTVWLRPSGLTNLRAQSTTPPDDSTPSGFTTETLRRRGPRTYPQQALPLEVIRKVRSWARNETDIAIGQLVVVAFFFAMRSCEYSDVGSRRTTSVIRVDDVRFRQKGQDLQTTDRGQLENADTVSITFRRQKNGDKGATVTQHRNDRQGQTDICPVRVLADLTTRVRSYDCHSRTNPKINAVRTQDSDEPQHISSKSILRQLRMATTRREEAWPPGEWHRHSLDQIRRRDGHAPRRSSK
ncbi:hypothetical protein MHU86_23596 [Fragilaria crotonensis]|nr:hypothetical protein MHU86_23596 [Fragilaria crotonensis]